MVAQLLLDDVGFWVADEPPEHENFSPPTLGCATMRMLLIVEDPEAVRARAIAVGARAVRPVSIEHRWLLGRVEGPYGHHWEIGKPLQADRPRGRPSLM